MTNWRLTRAGLREELTRYRSASVQIDVTRSKSREPK
jgi:hypothetical protein